MLSQRLRFVITNTVPYRTVQWRRFARSQQNYISDLAQRTIPASVKYLSVSSDRHAPFLTVQLRYPREIDLTDDFHNLVAAYAVERVEIEKFLLPLS